MNSWSQNRKRLILTLLILAVGILVGLPVYFLLRTTPTCSDGARDGDETGVDCGGSCQRLCPVESLPLLVQGDPRVLLVATSTYEVVALVDNPNTDAEIERARYSLKLYVPGSAVPMKTIGGEVYVPKGAEFALFAGPYAAEAGSLPTRATLEWDKSSLIWEKNTSPVSELEVGEKLFSRLDTSPRLTVSVSNLSLNVAQNVDLTALLYDASGNIFAASKTFVEQIPGGGETGAIFTWPSKFSSEAVQIKVIATILPGATILR